MKEQLKAAFTSFPHCIATYVAIVGAGWLLFFGWKPVKLDPPVHAVVNPEQVARQEAARLDGAVWAVGHTGSMRPLLQGGEYAVTVSRFADVRLGEVLVYRATYHHNPIVHRAVQKDSHGWLMSGDSAPHSESWARVNADNYIGTVVAVYRLP